MHIVVLGGAGDMGSYVVRDLVEYTDARVTIADYRVKQARRLATRLGERATGIFVDARNRDSLLGAMRDADAVVGCIGPFYAFAPRIAREAIRAGVHYVDIGDDYGPMEELFFLHEDAQAAGTTVITGLGWTPGLSNILARRAADQLHEVDEIKVSWVGGAADSQGLAVIKHVLYAITGNVPTYRDGQWLEVPARSGRERVEFPEPLGTIEVFHCGHPEPLTVPRYISARTVSLKGSLTPRWNVLLASLFVRLGLTRTPTRIERLARLVHSIEGLFRAGGIPLSGLRVDVTGLKDGQEWTYSFAATDKMGRLTGIPAAIGAVMLARGEIEARGVFAPEGCIDPEPFLAELTKREIDIVESRSPTAGVVPEPGEMRVPVPPEEAMAPVEPRPPIPEPEPGGAPGEPEMMTLIEPPPPVLESAEQPVSLALEPEDRSPARTR